MDESHKYVKEESHKLPTWSDALVDAKAQLAAARRRVRELTEAIRVCEQRLREGERFIGQGGD